jgi:hypothetical protein
VFFRIYANSEHRYSNTWTGWFTWSGIIAVTWVLAFIIAEIIPFFSDMLSLMSSLFGEHSFFLSPRQPNTDCLKMAGSGSSTGGCVI